MLTGTQLLTFWWNMLLPSSGTISMWRCASPCRNVTIYLLTLYHIQEDLNLHRHCCEILKSHGVEFVGKWHHIYYYKPMVTHCYECTRPQLRLQNFINNSLYDIRFKLLHITLLIYTDIYMHTIVLFTSAFLVYKSGRCHKKRQWTRKKCLGAIPYGLQQHHQLRAPPTTKTADITTNHAKDTSTLLPLNVFIYLYINIINVIQSTIFLKLSIPCIFFCIYTPFVIPPECTFLITTDIKWASPTCFGTCVPSSEGTECQDLKTKCYC
jgi:hypothetical protein